MRAVHKRLTFEDKFARKFWPQKSRLRSIRSDKKHNHKKLRSILKKEEAL
jgi:hypothetical protein